MKLDSFRELLLKKAGDPELESLVSFVKEDVLADLVIESLEKMARSKHKGDSANVPIRDFGVEMDPETEPAMLHDALSHHASHYKAAVKAGRDDLANQHAKQIFRLVDMGDQAGKHSQGKLHVEAVSPHPWERNAKTRQFTDSDGPVLAGNKKPGQFVTDTKGWRYRGSDYSFLKQAPHGSYANEVRKHGHLGAYPMEHIKVNGKHVDIQDIAPEDLKGYEEHPFDKHPVMDHFEHPSSKRTPELDAQWRQQHQDYAGSPHMDAYFDRQSKMEQANPEAYAQRGSKPSAPAHAAVDPLDVKSIMEGKQTQSEPAPAPAKEAAAPAKEMSPREKIMAANIPDALKSKLLASIKDE
jgi:hypothetical protein